MKSLLKTYGTKINSECYKKKHMKKIILALLIIASFSTSFAQTGKKKMKFYYYPSANVYQDVSNSQYAYDSSGTWVYTQQLPESIMLGENPRKVIVYHDSPDVWTDNKIHVVKYKNGVVKKDKVKKDKTTSSNDGQ